MPDVTSFLEHLLITLLKPTFSYFNLQYLIPFNVLIVFTVLLSVIQRGCQNVLSKAFPYVCVYVDVI